MFFWLIFVSLFLIIYLTNQHFFSYWSSRKIPYKKPKFLIGELGERFFGKKSFGEFIAEVYQKNKSKRIFGLFMSYRPVLMINDPVLINDVLIKEFSSFHDRFLPIKKETNILEENMFNFVGKKWRDLRGKLSPTFTSGKIKGMFGTVYNCAQTLQDYVMKNVEENEEIFDIRDLMARYTTTTISSVAFGIENDCINDPQNMFRKMGQKIFESGFLKIISALLLRFAPKFAHLFKVKRVAKDIEDFFVSVVQQTVNYRENHKEFERKDFMDLMIKLKNVGFFTGDVDDEDEKLGNLKDKNETTKLTFNEIVGQSFLFFVAGSETSSSTSSLCLVELSKNPSIQIKVQQEIDKILKSDEITYEKLTQMKYLDCCIDETLRKYPATPIIFRMCTKSHTFTDTKWTIDRGTLIFISLLGLHRDPDIFENPLKFMPERFLNSSTGNGVADGTFYLPFGSGPRNCIGSRMGKLQVKLGLVLLLSKFSFELVDKRMMNEEIEFSKKHFSPVPKNKLLLKAVLRKK